MRVTVRNVLFTSRPLLALFVPLLALLVALGEGTAVADPDDAAFAPVLTTAQLDELVGPVALYPDVVLDSLLPASVAPGDVAAAARFVASSGGQVQGAPEGTTWDVGLVALLQFPDVLQWMGDNPLWVERMGFAMAMQQGDVLVAIQRYRARAQAAGVLDSNEYILVEKGPQIVIHTRSPQLVYVPVYDPWALDSWVRGRPFYRSWFSFSFGTRGYWGRYHIFWGSGIYDYGEPWWWGRWRSPAVDWRAGRPVLWSASRHTNQPWTRAGWRTSGWGTRVVAPRTRRSATTTLRVDVALPTSRTSSRLRAPALRQPTSPAAPITRWSRSTPTTTPPTTPPQVYPKAAQPLPRAAERANPPIQHRPTFRVIPRGPVQQWSRRGSQSLERKLRTQPNVVPAKPGQRAAPAQPRGRQRQFQPFPPRRSVEPLPDGRRVRVHERRGHSVLAAS